MGLSVVNFNEKRYVFAAAVFFRYIVLIRFCAFRIRVDFYLSEYFYLCLVIVIVFTLVITSTFLNISFRV